MSSIEYYNKNATSFYERTIHTDMLDVYGEFLELLPNPSRILDAGCGVGRDSKYFLSQGHTVVAFDASFEMVKLSTQELNQPTLCLSFNDMTFQGEFDGVWANASLLHVPYDETRPIFEKIHRALKPGGVFLATYKYGDQKMSGDDREFYNMNEDTIRPYLEGLFDIVSLKEVPDRRNARNLGPRKSWLHFICRKK